MSLRRKRYQAAFLAGLMVLSLAITGASMVTPVKGDGTRFSFTLMTNQGNLMRITAAEIVKENLDDIGIEVNIQIVEWPTFVYENLLGQDFDAVIVGWTGADEDLKQIFHSEESDLFEYNFVGYNNSRADYLMDANRGEFNDTLRREMLFELQEIITDEAPYDFLVMPLLVVGVGPGWEGFICGPQDEDITGWVSLKNLTQNDGSSTFIEESIGAASELNPLFVTDSASSDVSGPMYPALLYYDQDLKYIGDFADTWDKGAGWFYYELRNDYQWTDGQQVTAEDWLFSYQYLYHANDEHSISKTTRSSLAEWIDQMYMPGGDPFKLNVTVNSTMYPDGYVIGLDDLNLEFVPEHIFNTTAHSIWNSWAEVKDGLGVSDAVWAAKGGDGSDYWRWRWVEDSMNRDPQNTASQGETPVTCGYWKFSSWDKDLDTVTLVRNDDYPRWSEAKNKNAIDTYIYKKGGTMDEISLSLQNGDIDVQDGPNFAYVSTLEADPNVQVLTSSSTDYTYMGMNLRRAPFDDVDVRRALNWAIDKDAIYEAAYFGYGEAGTGPIPSIWAEWYNPNVTTYTPRNTELAEQLLDDAGWPRAEEETDWAQIGLIGGIAAAAIVAIVLVYMTKIKGVEE